MNIENRELSQKLVDTIEFLKQSISKISVYDLNYYSMTELYYNIAKKINELIEMYHEFGVSISEEIIKQNECLHYLLNDGLIKEVVNKINQMVADGTMDTIINHNIFNDLNSQINKKVNKAKDTIYLNEYALEQNIVIDKLTDISSLLQYCVDNYKNIIMPFGYDYRIANTVNINKNCNIYCEGTIYVDDNTTAFIVGGLGSDKRIERNIFKFSKVYGNGKEYGSILMSLQHAIYNQFIIDYAENLGKVIELHPIDKNCSLGENQFKPHLWYGCNIAFHIMGADTWENRTWAEGSQLLAGFISGCNYGIKIEKNVLYSGMYVTTAIDNAEVTDSWDYYNDGNESPYYMIANLLLFRFIRFNRCQFKNIDSFWDANLKFKTTGEVHCDGALRQEGTEGHFRINNAQAEIFNPNIVFFDFKNTLSNDYDIRMLLENGELEFTSPNASACKITSEGFKLARSGSNISIATGENSAVINHNYGLSNTNYTVVCVPSWKTSYHLEVKNTVGFKVVFTNPAPEGATFDYFIVLCN